MTESVDMLQNHQQSDHEFADLVDELTQRLEAGEHVEFPAVTRDHPAYADRLRKLWPTMQMLAVTGASPQPGAALKEEQTRAPDRTLGDYSIIREIGRGGMGVVYQADQISLRRPVALKVLPFAAVMDQRQLTRFKNEAHIAGQLVHQNIVPVYAVGCERGVHYYAMQYIEGQSLAGVIKDLQASRGGRPSPKLQGIVSASPAIQPASSADPQPPSPDSRPASSAPALASSTGAVAVLSTHRSSKSAAYCRGVAQLGIQAANALEYAHQNGVIHRDVKPGNLLLDHKGNLWITDFGLARVETDGGLTLTGDVLGTLRYISPEQALAKRVVVDHRTDIYSLGVTLYELLTLRPAFDGHDRQEMMRQIAFGEPRRPRSLEKTIPAELQTIVLKAMEKNPADRYETAGALADDLNRFIEDKPILAKRPSLARRLGKWSQRHRSLVASGLFVLIFGLVITTLAMVREREHALLQQREMEKQLRIATSLRLAAQSQSTRNKMPIQSLLLAVAATDVTRRHGEGALPLAQESLREALSVVGGQPLLGNDLPVNLSISADGQRMATSSQGELRLWDLKKPWTSEVVLRGQSTESVVRAVSCGGRWIVTAEPNSTQFNLWDLTAADPLFVLPGNRNQLWHAQISPNDRWLVTAWEDRTLRVWDLSLDDPMATTKVLRGHKSPIWTLAVSPDSRWLATGTGVETGRARLWDLMTNDPNATSILLPMREHESTVRSVAFSPDSRWLATGSGVYGAKSDTAVKVWDLATDDPTDSPIELAGDSTEVETVQFSPNGRWLVSAGLDATARLWDMKAADIQSTQIDLNGHSDGIWDVAFTPDSRLLATGSHDQTARVWNLTADDPSAVSLVLRGHETWLTKVFFTPDSNWVITSSRGQKESRIWEISNWLSVFDSDTAYGPKRESVPLESAPLVMWGPKSLRGFRLIDEGSKLFATSALGHVCIWDLVAPHPSSSLVTFSGSRLSERQEPYRFALSRDGKWIAMASGDGAIDLWNRRAEYPRASLRKFKGPADGVPIVGFSPDSRWLTTTTRGERFRRVIAFSSNGRKLATNRTVWLWDLKSKDPTFQSRTLRAGNQTLEGTSEHTLLIWDLAATESDDDSFALRGHQREIRTIGFSADDRWLATGSADRTVRLWDMQSEDPNVQPYVLHGHDHPIANVVFCPDGRWLVTSSAGENSFDVPSVRLWDLTASGFWKKSIHLEAEILLPWSKRPFSPDGQWLSTANQDAVRLWNLTSPDPSKNPIMLRGHTSPPSQLQYSPDSRWLASVGGRWRVSDYTVRLWDLTVDDPNSSSVALRGPTKWAPEVVTFSPDSQRLIAGSRDGEVRIWDLRIEKLVQLARRVAGRELTHEECETFMLP